MNLLPPEKPDFVPEPQPRPGAGRPDWGSIYADLRQLRGTALAILQSVVATRCEYCGRRVSVLDLDLCPSCGAPLKETHATEI